MTAVKNHWNEYHRAWSLVTTPLRPNGEIVAAFARASAGIEGRALLLGVTPELAGLHAPLVAVDRNRQFVENVWPGNEAGRFAVVGDWLSPNFVAGSFGLCLGDGTFSNIAFPDEIASLHAELLRVLRPGARMACRLFAAPETAERPADLKAAALAGAAGNFHAFKLRFMMAAAAVEREPNVRLDRIYESFCALFPDRDDLVRRTGWNRGQVDTIEHYKGSAIVYSFPTRDRLLSVIANGFSGVRFVSSGTYELAEQCPLLVMEKD